MKIPHYILCSYSEKGFGWFRVFGIGLHWKDIRIHKLLFSERNGYSKYIILGDWLISYLPKYKIYKNTITLNPNDYHPSQLKYKNGDVLIINENKLAVFDINGKDFTFQANPISNNLTKDTKVK
jgi:hypothetical protein